MGRTLIFKTFGARQYTAQVNRIDQAFKALGLTEHNPEIDNTTPDFIFSNDAGYHEEALYFRENFAPNSKVILNVLDLFPHLVDEKAHQSRIRLCEQLGLADAITTISHTVARDIRKFFIINEKIPGVSVIGVPQMNVFKDDSLKGKRSHRVLMSGRLNDPNKRAILGIHSLQLLGFQEKEVAIVGSEYPGWGDRHGIITEGYLNELYNNVDFVVMPSFSEGVGLQFIEAMGCGAIPVICNDLSTKEEFLPRDKFPEYNSIYPDVLSIANFIAKYMQDNNAKDRLKQKLYKHYKENLEEKFAAKSVAKKIIEVYKGII